MVRQGLQIGYDRFLLYSFEVTTHVVIMFLVYTVEEKKNSVVLVR
jgi:hypothetical protein